MSILSFLQSKKIIPANSEIIKQQAKRLARDVTSPTYFIVNLNSKEISDFSNEFGNEILNILLKRMEVLKNEIEITEDAIENLK